MLIVKQSTVGEVYYGRMDSSRLLIPAGISIDRRKPSLVRKPLEREEERGG